MTELVERATALQQGLDDLHAIDEEAALQLWDEVRRLRWALRHVDDIVRFVLHDQADLAWRVQGEHVGRYHNAVRARYQRAARRHPGGLDQAIREPVQYDEDDRLDTGD